MYCEYKYILKHCFVHFFVYPKKDTFLSHFASSQHVFHLRNMSYLLSNDLLYSLINFANSTMCISSIFSLFFIFSLS